MLKLGAKLEPESYALRNSASAFSSTECSTSSIHTVSYRAKYYFYSERQLALAKPMGQEGVSQAVARNIIKEAALYPGEAISKVIKRVVDTAPELRFSPEHAEIVKLGSQTQVCLTKLDARIKPGARIDLYAKFAEVKVASIEKKALRDLTEEDAKAEGGYSLVEFRAFWKETHTVWNPKLKVFLVSFEVQKLAKGGKVK